MREADGIVADHLAVEHGQPDSVAPVVQRLLGVGHHHGEAVERAEDGMVYSAGWRVGEIIHGHHYCRWASG